MFVDTSNFALGYLARRVLPMSVRRSMWQTIRNFNRRTISWRLFRLRRRLFSDPPHTSGVERFLDYTVHITDGPNFYMQYKDEFIHRIYHFEAQRSDPLIIDGGSNIGMSILYFKHVYPQARIISFEPDPAIFALLQENINCSKLDNVTLINAGLSAQTGNTTFVPDGNAGGHVGRGAEAIKVQTDRLSRYLDEPVDFVKLNIEGEELPVLQEAEASGRLRNVRELVLEYHGWPDGQQQLGDILNLLDRQGFRYLVHDFDTETCGASKPPFSLTSQTIWFCLVYARRWGDKSDSG